MQVEVIKTLIWIRFAGYNCKYQLMLRKVCVFQDGAFMAITFMKVNFQNIWNVFDHMWPTEALFSDQSFDWPLISNFANLVTKFKFLVKISKIRTKAEAQKRSKKKLAVGWIRTLNFQVESGWKWFRNVSTPNIIRGLFLR